MHLLSALSEYCEDKYKIPAEKLKRYLTSKCATKICSNLL